MIIRTKIVATVGPASQDVEVIRSLAQAGVDVFRVNFSHGSEEQHELLLSNIREVEAEINHPLAVMADLCGPKIRVGPISGGSVSLCDGQELIIQSEPIEGDAEKISTTLSELAGQVSVGETILLDDGKIRLEVRRVSPPGQFVCEVIHGGVLSTGKGVNLPNTPLKLSALTDKDKADAAWIASRDFDYVAISFVLRADDVNQLRDLLQAADCQAQVIAKIEKPQAVENIASIVEAADGIMVARGDLGVELDLPAVPVAQKNIARICRAAGKPCIIATQMLESMTSAATPTRAEVSDVANAVLDHADAVMLSGETAVGKFPVRAVSMMNDISAEVQSYDDRTAAEVRIPFAASPTTAAIAAAVCQIIDVEDIAAIAVFTLSGGTARLFSKHRPPCPILGLSPDIRTVRRMCLYYGVEPMQAQLIEHTRQVVAIASKFALERGIAERGQKIIVVSGRPLNKPGRTNTLVVHTIE